MSEGQVPDSICVCWFCGGRMKWNGDTPFDDLGMPGDGLLASLSCIECEAECCFVTKPSSIGQFVIQWEDWLTE